MTKRKPKLHLVIAEEWTEYERGWGCRPDGYSIHLSMEDYKAYCAEYWSGMPTHAPDEYSQESGKPYLAVVSQELYTKLKANTRRGLRTSDRDPVRRATPDEIISANVTK